MINPQNNDQCLQSLAWTIYHSQGQFKLVFASCKYASLHKQISEQLREICSVNIQEIELQPSVQQLYSTIQKQVKNSTPEALMVFGLESVNSIDNLLISTNQVREEFRKNLSFPLVLWALVTS